MNTQQSFAFPHIDVPGRSAKPRTRGLTMMIDWGLPHTLQLDCLEAQGMYVDEAKIAASIPKVMEESYLKKKIASYRAADIFTFPGGLFTEVAIAKGSFDYFLEDARMAGFSGIEISDNLISISPAEKKSVIARAVNDFGMTVMGEVGRKEGSMSADELIADVENCLEAGAKLVLLEAHELFHGDIRMDVMDALRKRIPQEKIMFELPVAVLPDVTKSYKTKILYWLIKQFGPEVNLANVEWDEVYFTEISRRGICGESSEQYERTSG